MKYFPAVLALATTLIAVPAHAALINGTGNVTPNVIFGSGNANGSFTGINDGFFELALRGKLRYNLAGQPAGIYNYDGNKTYTFQPSDGVAPVDRSLFSFDWSINVDPTGNQGTFLNQFTYLLQIDYDPSANVDFVEFDLINPSADYPLFDHSIGNNTTTSANDLRTTSSVSDYLSYLSTNNVAQNSWNLGFFEPLGFDVQTQGMYTITLSAFDRQNNRSASTSIDIIFGQVPASVPEPSALMLMFGGLMGLGAVARRRRNSKKN
ncbi:PEP-CTERM sorting domain-containing protein [Rheinheimera sp. UJ51]|uniref:PEP-CTERM sorting domain-containing protein n=1 Tax=unclassified Rheinheimera TaxID=115860 RepID=UPI001E4FD5A6|nr:MULTISPECIES: PEP-CTERM sorting domain-containing protein [unclassified Rheinheimera]MCC5451238.1 PEP-CTERM sorting domain-containing protein [Rheinheimera sp. UJ51]MCF4009975.1 PEP-CTERM sorting domain-containing protein [Rheinheimera sp. UJ63]